MVVSLSQKNSSAANHKTGTLETAGSENWIHHDKVTSLSHSLTSGILCTHNYDLYIIRKSLSMHILFELNKEYNYY